jgi:DNA-binding transcriptional ArsR family regulator
MPRDEAAILSDAADGCEVFLVNPGRVAAVRRLMVGAREVALLAETFRALGDSTRVKILDALSHGELCVCDLATLVGLSQSAISHQLRVLRTLRLVRSRREGRMVFYALDDDHIIGLFREGLRHVEEVPPAAEAADGAAPRATAAGGEGR